MLIATPGRFLEMVDKNLQDARKILSSIDFLVVDEADRFDSNQLEVQLKSILAILPKSRKTCLFSATLNRLSSLQMFHFGLADAVKIKVKSKQNSIGDIPQ